MKTIKVPEEIKLEVGKKDSEGNEVEQVFTFKEFLLAAINTHEPFGQGIKNIRQGYKLAELAESEEEELELEDADYEVLKAAVEACKWNPFVARNAIAFYDALEL